MPSEFTDYFTNLWGFLVYLPSTSPLSLHLSSTFLYSMYSHLYAPTTATLSLFYFHLLYTFFSLRSSNSSTFLYVHFLCTFPLLHPFYLFTFSYLRSSLLPSFAFLLPLHFLSSTFLSLTPSQLHPLFPSNTPLPAHALQR